MGSKAFSWKSTNTAFTAGVAVQNALNVLYLSVMKYKLTIVFILCFLHPSFGQHLDHCSACNSKVYSESDIVENKLYEIELLRNEIFARHNYIFNNERLNEYFSKFSWRDTVNSEPYSNSSLNTFELKNIETFKKVERQMLKKRQQLIQELKLLKSAIQLNDGKQLALFIPERHFKNANFEKIKSAIITLPLDDIHWFKGKAKYVVEIDNGRRKALKAININANMITILVIDPMAHTELMKKEEAFKYPSDYSSEDEHLVGIEFLFKNGELTFKKFIGAG